MLYRLNRFSRAHRILRRFAYALLWRLPDRVKWPVMGMLLRNRLPYRLLRPGDIVVQIGAPWDLLRAGRSRAIHFSRTVGVNGRVLVVEPDPDNVRELNGFIARRGITNITVVPLGVWSKKTTLRFLVDRANPAANLVEDVLDSKRRDLDRFHVTEIEVDTLENILRREGFPVPTLVSITTNGSESEILKGMEGLARQVAYIATITDEAELPKLRALNFSKCGGDDRGYTFRNGAVVPSA